MVVKSGGCQPVCVLQFFPVWDILELTEKRKGLTIAGRTVSPKSRQPPPCLPLEVERSKRQKRNGNNNVGFGQKEGRGWGNVFFEDQPRRTGVQINGRGEREGGQEQQDSGGGAVGGVRRLGFHSYHTISSVWHSKANPVGFGSLLVLAWEMQRVIPSSEAHKVVVKTR